MTTFALSTSLVLVAALVATYVTMQRKLRRQTRSADVIVALNGVLQSQVDELQSRSRDFELLGEMSELLQVSSSIAEACDVLSAFGMALFHDLTGAVLITKSAPGMVESIASWGANPPSDFITTDCWALRRGQTHIGSAAGIRCLHAPAGTTICVPMLALGEGLGVVTLTAAGSPVIGEQVERFAKTFADQIALAVANLRMQETLRTRAVRDALTGLFNRRYMEESLACELARASRRHLPVGVMMIDVDHFKRFNDAYGHTGGDALLQQFARLLQNVVRDEDIVCRYGGEEFVVILPDADSDVVRQRAEALVEAARQLDVHLDGEELGRITVSAGFAVSNDRSTGAAALIAAADRALYNAKSAGRDRVSGPVPHIVAA
jgi:diguanylate cyclase (GGDEF)-like protein